MYPMSEGRLRVRVPSLRRYPSSCSSEKLKYNAENRHHDATSPYPKHNSHAHAHAIIDDGNLARIVQKFLKTLCTCKQVESLVITSKDLYIQQHAYN